jgi:hypothetical protein
MEIWKYGNMEIWKYGNMEIWKYGNMEIWKYGSMGDEMRFKKQQVSECPVSLEVTKRESISISGEK